MKTALSDDQFRKELASHQRSAFRLELQPAYTVDYERDLFDSFLAGHPEPPTNRERFRAWYDQIAQQVAAGITTERVRVYDDPPTDYQRWTGYMDRWNIEAGETIHYLRRDTARQAGITDAFGGRDWWLLDNQRLLLMAYDDQGRRIDTELVTDDSEVEQARSWRDLAITTARGETR